MDTDPRNVVNKMPEDNATHTQQEIKQQETENPPDEKAPPVQATFKIWFALSSCLICYIVSLYGMMAISTQYFSKRIARDDYDFNYDDEDDKNCDNASDDEESRMDKVQKDVAQLQLRFTITTGVPSLIVCLLVGSYSDFIGRKPLLLMSTVGGFLKVAVLCFIVGYESNIHYFYIGAFLDGLVGSYYTTVIAITSIIADITYPSERAVKFAILEGILLASVAASQIGIGLLIKLIGYIAPCLSICVFFVVVIILVILFCPETSERNPDVSKNPLLHFKRVFGFYLFNDSSNSRPLYLLGIIIFFIGTATNTGRGNVEVLFETSYPLCWDALQLGLFTAIRLLAMAAVAVVFLKVMKNRCSLEVTGFICALSAAGGFVVESFARTSPVMFLSAAIGVLYLAIAPIPRAMLSQLALPEEQGALFSSLSTVDVIAGMMASTIFTFIYDATLDSFKGAVFIAVALLCVINGCFLLVFRHRRRVHHHFQTQAKEATGQSEPPMEVVIIPKTPPHTESSPLLTKE